MKELGVDKMNSAQMNSPEVKSQIEKLKLAAETLNTQVNVRDAKRAIEQQTNNAKTTEAKLDIIAKKLATGQELTVAEVKEIGKFSDTPIVDGSQGFNFRSPVEAMNVVMANKLGITRGSEKFNVLQGELAKYGEFVNVSNQQFKGESKQTQAKKELYIGKILDARKIQQETNSLTELIESNPELSIVHQPVIAENNKRLKEVKQEMVDLIVENREVEKTDYESDIKFASETAKDLGIRFEELTASKFNELANTKGFNNTSDGVYLPEENAIYINRDVALQNGAISVGSHELAHALLRRSFKNNKGIFTAEGIDAINDFVNNTMSNEQRAKVQQRINQKYNPNSKDFQQKQYEEYLNIFLDGVKRGEYKLNDTFSSKLKSIVEGNRGVDLTTGKGIKNFVDLLARSGRNGVLDVRLKDFYKEGEATGEAIEGEAKLSASEKSLSRDVDELIGIERNELGDITILILSSKERLMV
jgi:hypothetical protein